MDEDRFKYPERLLELRVKIDIARSSFEMQEKRSFDEISNDLQDIHHLVDKCTKIEPFCEQAQRRRRDVLFTSAGFTTPGSASGECSKPTSAPGRIMSWVEENPTRSSSSSKASRTSDASQQAPPPTYCPTSFSAIARQLDKVWLGETEHVADLEVVSYQPEAPPSPGSPRSPGRSTKSSPRSPGSPSESASGKRSLSWLKAEMKRISGVLSGAALFSPKSAESPPPTHLRVQEDSSSRSTINTVEDRWKTAKRTVEIVAKMVESERWYTKRHEEMLDAGASSDSVPRLARPPVRRGGTESGE